MATRDPYSEWKPFTGKSHVPLTHDIVCVHTMVGTLAGSWAWANRSGAPYWHYGVGGDGEAWQCQDLDFRSAANLEGNWHVIPIETADINEGVFPRPWANPLWTPAQVDTLVKLIAWLCKRYNIPPVLIPDTKPGRRGLAYHRQGVNPTRVPGGELWSKSNGKECPAARIHQFTNIIVPRVRALVTGQGGDPSMSAADVSALKQYINQQLGELRTDIKKDATTIAEEHDDPGFFRVVDEGWVTGWPVYHTDFLGVLHQVEHEGPLDTFVAGTKKLAGETTTAARVAPALLNELHLLIYGQPRNTDHLKSGGS